MFPTEPITAIQAIVNQFRTGLVNGHWTVDKAFIKEGPDDYTHLLTAKIVSSNWLDESEYYNVQDAVTEFIQQAGAKGSLVTSLLEQYTVNVSITRLNVEAPIQDSSLITITVFYR